MSRGQRPQLWFKHFSVRHKNNFNWAKQHVVEYCPNKEPVDKICGPSGCNTNHRLPRITFCQHKDYNVSESATWLLRLHRA